MVDHFFVIIVAWWVCSCVHGAEVLFLELSSVRASVRWRYVSVFISVLSVFVAGALSPAITAGKHVLVMGRCSTLTLGFALVYCCSFTLKKKSDCTDNIVSLLGVHFLFHRFMAIHLWNIRNTIQILVDNEVFIVKHLFTLKLSLVGLNHAVDLDRKCSDGFIAVLYSFCTLISWTHIYLLYTFV